MSDPPIDPRWPEVLRLSAHELRNPMTTVAGYIRMLLMERTGPLNATQRRYLDEAQKSCGRVTSVIDEASQLAKLEEGEIQVKTEPTDLQAVLEQAIEQLPPLPSHDVAVHLEVESAPAMMTADPKRLTQAFTSIIAALRREVIVEEGLTIRQRRTGDGYDISLGDPKTLAALEAESEATRAVFDEFRGGVGLSVLIARRIINRHGGRIYGAPEGRKTGARIVLPA
jgi:signal transduction histidine kinase